MLCYDKPRQVYRFQRYLLPKEKYFSMMIQKIELMLSSKPGIIKSVTIFESEDSFTKLVFKKSILNDTIDDSMFRKI